ncbi:MAG: DUF2252 domain-containing protein [Azospirillum sp.]|nr:DUF2252 domain-containing protein [Azospirillum sp.]
MIDRFLKATRRYEAWLRDQVPVREPALALKHVLMKRSASAFLRASFYWWLEDCATALPTLWTAPKLLAVGDLHADNFGTWHDENGNWAWGINDFDDAWVLPFTNDLIRLATSIRVMVSEAESSSDNKKSENRNKSEEKDSKIEISAEEICQYIIEGYRARLDECLSPITESWLNDRVKPKAAEKFWQKFPFLPECGDAMPGRARALLVEALPRDAANLRFASRDGGLGSLGRRRFVVTAETDSGRFAAEVKQRTPPAFPLNSEPGRDWQDLLPSRPYRIDPSLKFAGRWLVRAASPDRTKLRLGDLDSNDDRRCLIQAMGWETADFHLGRSDGGDNRCGGVTGEVLDRFMKEQPNDWLDRASAVMTDRTLAVQAAYARLS